MENIAIADGNGNIIIQNVDGSSVVVNINDTEELRKMIMNLGSDMKSMPQNLLKLMEQIPNEASAMSGANIYLTTLVSTSGPGMYGARLKFGVSITNLNKEHRYFSRLYFVVTPAFTLDNDIEHDTFEMVPEGQSIFPARLEYGQPISTTFDIKPEGFYLYEGVLGKDPEAYLQAFATTTLGEVYESNKFKISQLVEWYNSLTKN